MKVITSGISLKELQTMTKNRFGELVKAVVDVDREVVALDAELHSDEEAELLTQGSRQESLWGINIYPFLEKKDWIEFDSMINVRPAGGNRSREVEDTRIRKKIISIVHKLIQA